MRKLQNEFPKLSKIMQIMKEEYEKQSKENDKMGTTAQHDDNNEQSLKQATDQYR